MFGWRNTSAGVTIIGGLSDAENAVSNDFGQERGREFAALFASLRWCAKIVVVVDSGSTDGTREEADRLGARVLVHV